MITATLDEVIGGGGGSGGGGGGGFGGCCGCGDATPVAGTEVMAMPDQSFHTARVV